MEKTWQPTIHSLSPLWHGNTASKFEAQWASKCPPRRPNGVKTWKFPDAMMTSTCQRSCGAKSWMTEWQNDARCTQGWWLKPHSFFGQDRQVCCLRNEEKCLQGLSLSLRSGSSKEEISSVCGTVVLMTASSPPESIPWSLNCHR